ncbi:deoxyguanosinetriphosphate triphosphohydrolase [Clostridium sp. 19966]|uniref:deoxyguanosinetriphosphate triphosphohydrolase n=1 Tax=Clostridium sp. 19966 TaxID=2768166 RepID=UPI0028DF3CB3|nr:deoxyguanosinetriphosphate triphosphohydrolase [Clostridium sp. 19966]MDT8715328.1 deoxyguanosinetriphosphate triphosphohydrolase [Clostridium sp. 19966]
MNIREKIEYNETILLNSFAKLSKNHGERDTKENEDEIRTAYMVDRDRIIHSKSFRRLKHKTQVYIKTWGDHYRTRLTHTLEVAQVAKTIGKGIGLNEDLIEAIALGHDIGHVAFAHTGEEVLNEIIPGGFKHNENSVRVLKVLEKQGKGLNLTPEVLDGILYHSGFNNIKSKAYTLEGQVVRYSDKIAYINHDIDDSIRAGILKLEDIPKDIIDTLGISHGERIDTLVKDCIYTTIANINKGELQVALSEKVGDAMVKLRNFLFKNIYKGDILKQEREKAQFVVRQVYEYFLKNLDKLPEFYREISEREGAYQGVTDYISGMSDDFCLYVFNDIYVPKLVIY